MPPTTTSPSRAVGPSGHQALNHGGRQTLPGAQHGVGQLGPHRPLGKLGLAVVGNQHGQLSVGSKLRVGDSQASALEVRPCLENYLCLSWQLDMEAQAHSRGP